MSRRRNKTLRAGSMGGMVYHCGFKVAKKKSADAGTPDGQVYKK